MTNGEFEFLPDGNEWTWGRPALMIGCGGGYLLAYQAGDAGEYDEVGVDFVSDDGRLVQLAIVGREEATGLMRVFAYDGLNEDVAHTQHVSINDDSHWYTV